MSVIIMTVEAMYFCFALWFVVTLAILGGMDVMELRRRSQQYGLPVACFAGRVLG